MGSDPSGGIDVRVSLLCRQRRSDGRNQRSYVDGFRKDGEKIREKGQGLEWAESLLYLSSWYLRYGNYVQDLNLSDPCPV